jgi:hypothetical protein
MIRNRQVKKELDTIIQGILKNGSLPYYKQVMNKLRISLESFTPGQPKFFPKLIESFSVSNPEEINKLLNLIYEDLIIISEETNYQQDKLLSVLNYYYIEINKIIMDLEDKNIQIDNIKDHTIEIKMGKIIYENFENFLNIDYDGDEEKEIPKTNCLVDLRQYKAYNWRRRNKIDISKSKYTVNGLNITNIHDFDNCLKDTISDSWICSVYSNSNTGNVEIELEFEKEEKISCVQAKSLLERNITAELYLLIDKEYLNINETVFSNKTVEFNFKENKVGGIKLVLTKSEPDVFTTSNIFYFGLQNISIFMDSKYNDQVLVSKAYPVENISDLKLETESIIYPYSNIRYNIIFEYDNIIKWAIIIPGKDFSIPEEILNINNKFTGDIRLVATFHNSDNSPQLLNYKIITK